MSHRFTLPISLASLALVLCASCGKEPTRPLVYLPNVSPVNVVLNLEKAFAQRDVAAYADLRAPEFIGTLQPTDVLELGKRFYTLAEDSVRVGSILSSSDLSALCLWMNPGPPEAANDLGMPDDAVRIRAKPQVTLSLQKGGARCLRFRTQDLFFRPGRAARGESEGRWYLLEWREIPSVSAAETVDPDDRCPCESGVYEDAEWFGDWNASPDWRLHILVLPGEGGEIFPRLRIAVQLGFGSSRILLSTSG